jgi:hypothetical protein
VNKTQIQTNKATPEALCCRGFCLLGVLPEIGVDRLSDQATLGDSFSGCKIANLIPQRSSASNFNPCVDFPHLHRLDGYGIILALTLGDQLIGSIAQSLAVTKTSVFTSSIAAYFLIDFSVQKRGQIAKMCNQIFGFTAPASMHFLCG